MRRGGELRGESSENSDFPIGIGQMRGGLLNLTQAFNKTLFSETGACSGGCNNSPAANQNEMVVYPSSFPTSLLFHFGNNTSTKAFNKTLG